MIKLGSDSEASIYDMVFMCYTCYLIAQNWDPCKEQIAFAQNHFTIQTCKQGILEERIALVERLCARQNWRKLKQSFRNLSMKDVYKRKLMLAIIQNRTV